jgi:hypothetical protein
MRELMNRDCKIICFDRSADEDQVVDLWRSVFGYQRGHSMRLHAEQVLADLGFVKINLQIMEGNEKVERFYHRLGYSTEKSQHTQGMSAGKRAYGALLAV